MFTQCSLIIILLLTKGFLIIVLLTTQCLDIKDFFLILSYIEIYKKI